METYSEIIGLPVLCSDNGKKAGTVADLFFCPETRNIIAFVVVNQSLIQSKNAVLVKDVVSLGRDALIIKSKNCFIKVRYLDNNILVGNQKLSDFKVYSRQGDYFGSVKDVLFDFKTKRIEGLKVSNGLFYDVIEGRNIIPLFGKVEFGEEYIIIDREAIEEIVSTGGGLKNKFLNEKQS